MDFNFGTILTKRAQLEPNRPAIVSRGEVSSFRQFNERSNRLSHTFTALGVKRGDRVGMLLANSNHFLEAYFGLLKIGAILVPLNWRLAAPELELICGQSGLETVVFGSELTKNVENIRSGLSLKEYVCTGLHAPTWARDQGFIDQHSTDEPKVMACGDDRAVIVYTAGTTGSPKGAVLTHENLFWWCHSLSTTLGFSRGPILVVIPLFYGFGFNYSNAAALLGCTTVLMEAFDPLKVLETIQQERVETFPTVPTMLQRMADVPNFEMYMRGVRLLLCGGAPLPVSLRQTCLRHGVRIWDVLGLTEAGAVTALDPEKASEKEKSTGLPFYYIDARVVDENGSDVDTGQVGELLVKGPAVIKEYWNAPEATKAAIEDGWFHTGDLVRLDEEGYVYIVDRKKDMIISGAEKIYPAEVENVLCAHPRIAEAGVIGQPDEIWGETVCAVIRPKPGQTLAAHEITEFCQGKLARFKIPKRIVFTDETLPRNAIGKVLRRTLRHKLNSSERTR